MLTDQDIYLFREGTHGRLYAELGAHANADGGGVRFAVWAPNAAANLGDRRLERLEAGERPARAAHRRIGNLGGRRAGRTARPGVQVPHHLPGGRLPRREGRSVRALLRAAAGDRIARLDSRLRSGTMAAWMASRAARNGLDAPMSIYELHVGFVAPQGRQVPQLPGTGA